VAWRSSRRDRGRLASRRAARRQRRRVRVDRRPIIWLTSIQIACLLGLLFVLFRCSFVASVRGPPLIMPLPHEIGAVVINVVVSLVIVFSLLGIMALCFCFWTKRSLFALLMRTPRVYSPMIDENGNENDKENDKQKVNEKS
jgi:hypothetical protein